MFTRVEEEVGPELLDPAKTVAYKATKNDNNRAAQHILLYYHIIIITVPPLPFVATPMKIIGSTIVRTVIIKSVTPTTL